MEVLRDARMRWEYTTPMQSGTCGTCIMLGRREEEDRRRGLSAAYHRRTCYNAGRKGEMQEERMTG